jgi:hypothetical protein
MVYNTWRQKDNGKHRRKRAAMISMADIERFIRHLDVRMLKRFFEMHGDGLAEIDIPIRRIRATPPGSGGELGGIVAVCPFDLKAAASWAGGAGGCEGSAAMGAI